MRILVYFWAGWEENVNGQTDEESDLHDKFLYCTTLLENFTDDAIA